MFTQKKYMQLLYFLIILIFLLISLWLIVKLYPFYQLLFKFIWQVSLPFLIALLIAYLLYPLIQWLNRYQIPKALAVIIIFLSFFLTMGILIYRAYPAMIYQLNELNEQLPELIYMYESFIITLYDSTAFFPDGFHEQLDQFIKGIEQKIEQFLANLLQSTMKIFDLIIVMTLIPVLVFYFLKDYESIKNYMKRIIPNQHRSQVGYIVKSLDQTLGKYIRAQIFISTLLALITYIPFHLFNLQYPLLLATIIGITNIIPYFGPIIGAIPAILVAMSDSYYLVIVVLITIVLLQIIEGNFLSPYIVGKSINVHPIVIIFVLLIGSKIGGILGMILAVPFLAICKSLVVHIPIKWRRSLT